MKHMIVRLHLKSGQTIQFEAEKVTTARNQHTGEIESVEWAGFEGGEKPQAVGPNVIAAVTVEHVKGE